MFRGRGAHEGTMPALSRSPSPRRPDLRFLLVTLTAFVLAFKCGHAAPALPGPAFPVFKDAEALVRTCKRRLAEAGYHAVLVGESLVTAPDPAAAVRALARPA